MDKFFDLCRTYQKEIPQQEIAEILRGYADRLDWVDFWWTILLKSHRLKG